MTDPITDMLNKIRNACAVKKPEVSVPFSKLKNEILKVMQQEGFIGEIKKSAKGKMGIIKISLKYNNGEQAFSGLKRVSRPGQRIYAKNSEIKRVRGGHGISIISTPKGIMTNKEAKKSKLGGEIICEIW